MGFRSFSLLLGLRVGLLVMALAGFVYLVLTPGYPVLRLILGVTAALLLGEVVRFVQRTNRELSRFLDTIRYADFSQRFQMEDVGAGFEDLGNVFTALLARFQDLRIRQEETLRHLKAMMEHVPVPLVSMYQDGRLELQNNAARRLFGSTRVQLIDDLDAFGADLAHGVTSVAPGERRLVRFRHEGTEQRCVLAATEIAIAGQVERLISLQNIQSELDSVQLQAWQDLVRVLTHEIMNSITPVASLAKTAADLVDDAIAKVEDLPEVVRELDDVKSAVDTVARRSDGLMHFVQSYRRLTRLPAPSLETLQIAEVFRRVAELLEASWEAKGIELHFNVRPRSLTLQADPEMLEQILLNLLKNAEQALEQTTSPRVEVAAYLNRQGRVNLDVADNGPGISDDVASEVFVPFFTTKRDGSGVGLALTRQVMIAHGGTATLTSREGEGATFTLSF